MFAPPTRSDVLHPIDIQEDVAIAYGYDNLTRTIPRTNTVGRQVPCRIAALARATCGCVADGVRPQLPLNKLSDQLREGVAQAGFLEVRRTHWRLLLPAGRRTRCVTAARATTDADLRAGLARRELQVPAARGRRQDGR